MSRFNVFLTTLFFLMSSSSSQAETPRELSQALFYAAHIGHMASVVDLINRGANVNYANGKRETAMHAAAGHGHLQVIQYLRSRQAHLNPRTVENWIPLHHAVRFGHAHIANYLLQQGAPIYMKTRTGQTVFDIAKSTGDQRMINLLEGYRRR